LIWIRRPLLAECRSEVTEALSGVQCFKAESHPPRVSKFLARLRSFNGFPQFLVAVTHL